MGSLRETTERKVEFFGEMWSKTKSISLIFFESRELFYMVCV